MTRAAMALAGVMLVATAFLYAFAVRTGPPEPDAHIAAAPPPATAASTEGEARPGLLYGRVTTDDGAVYEGRLRFGATHGRSEEALWSHYFNGFKDGNPWAAHAPSERLPQERLSFELFGLEIAWERPLGLGRPFMARLGDIALIEPSRRDIRVTLRSGTVVELDRFSADDLADGVRVWDPRRGIADLEEWGIRSIEFLPAPAAASAAPVEALYGTVRTRQGDFTGLIQWDREAALGSDRLDSRSAEGERSLRFDAIRSIARHASGGSLVTLRDGREMVLSGTREVDEGNRGVYVDDARYGRVLVSWEAFERLDLTHGGGRAPAYEDFAPGRPLTGTVVTRSGRRLAGRLVYDLDESETTETLDAPAHSVDYTIPFGLVASIVLPGVEPATVTLRSGEELRLERTGDLGEWNAGVLVFSGTEQPAEYLPWTEVARIDFDPAPRS